MNRIVVQMVEVTPNLQAGGTLTPGKHLYIERPEDAQVFDLLKASQYVNILTSRQMGKSSLVMQTIRHLTEDGARSAYVDLAAELGSAATTTAQAYYQGLLGKIRRGLALDADVAAWWSAHPQDTFNQRLLAFFRDVVGEQIAAPVVVFLDEIDSTLKLNFTDDLFTALRGMYNERSLIPSYARLSFCLIGVATPNELIKERRTTPYNVGRTIALRDFDQAEHDLTPLVRNLNNDPDAGQQLLKRVLHWTGGHPYLTLRLCQELQAKGETDPDGVDRHVHRSFGSLDKATDDVHFQSILRFVEERFTEDLKSLNLYEQILKGKPRRDLPTLAHLELKLSGLVKRNTLGNLIVRNRIYENLFNESWLTAMTPLKSLHTYRARSRRLTVLSSILGSIALIGLAMQFSSYITTQPALSKIITTAIGPERYLTLIGLTVTRASSGSVVQFYEEADQEVFDVAIAAIGTMNDVVELSLSNTLIDNLSGIETVETLRILDVSGSKISSISPIARLRNLESLNLSDTDIEDFASLEQLEGLTSLNLKNTSISNLRSLSTLVHLQRLNLERTDILSLDNLNNLTELQQLDVEETRVSDISGVRGLSNLVGLDLSKTGVTDIDTVVTLSSLKVLLLGEGTWNLEDFFHASSLYAPRYFRMYFSIWNRDIGSPVVDISALSHLPQLMVLDIGATRVRDITALGTLQGLEYLNLYALPINSVQELQDLKRLRYLVLESTFVSEQNVAELRRLLAGNGNADVQIVGP